MLRSATAKYCLRARPLRLKDRLWNEFFATELATRRLPFRDRMDIASSIFSWMILPVIGRTNKKPYRHDRLFKREIS